MNRCTNRKCIHHVWHHVGDQEELDYYRHKRKSQCGDSLVTLKVSKLSGRADRFTCTVMDGAHGGKRMRIVGLPMMAPVMDLDIKGGRIVRVRGDANAVPAGTLCDVSMFPWMDCNVTYEFCAHDELP
jgi:hypothetical protein